MKYLIQEIKSPKLTREIIGFPSERPEIYFNGRIRFPEFTLSFSPPLIDDDLNKKIDKIESANNIYYGLIPIEFVSIGRKKGLFKYTNCVICKADYFESKDKQNV